MGQLPAELTDAQTVVVILALLGTIGIFWLALALAGRGRKK